MTQFGHRVREAAEQDLGSISEVLTLAYGRPYPIAALRFYLAQSNMTVYIAQSEDNPEIVLGVGVCAKYESTGWLGLISVRPKFQRKGLGRSLTNWGIENLRVRGIRTFVLIATAQGRPLYEDLGFKARGNYLVFEGPPRSGPLLDLGIRPLSPKDWGSVEALDLSATGERRGSLLRALQLGSVVLDEEGRLLGYHLPAPWGHGAGPSVAENPETGRLLIDAARSFEGEGPARIIVPEENRACRDYLERSGFELNRQATYMVHGPWPKRRPERIWGICSMALG